MRIIIIGASGLIGHALYSLALNSGENVIGTYNEAPRNSLVHLDIRSASIRSVVPDLGHGDVVYMLAAYTNPSWVHENYILARELNVISTKRVIDEVFDAGAFLLFMSSVEVFDGEDGAYNENAEPRPLNQYGAMKLEIENYLETAHGNSCIVRTGWNVGWDLHHRCVVRLTYDTLMCSGAKMAKDNIFSVSDVHDTAEGLFRLREKQSLKICHLASNPCVIRSELASYIKACSVYGDEMSYRETFFSDIPYSEPRARLNHLDNSRAIHELSMEFRNTQDIIKEKVELLDQGMMARRVL